MSELKKVKPGMYECIEVATGEKVVYYSTTVNALVGKGILKDATFINDKDYNPRGK